MSLQIATKNLQDFSKMLNELGIVFWLDGGTLLGAYRDKEFCVDDETDIDLCTWINYKSDEIIEKAIELGFKVHHKWDMEFAFTRDEHKIDLFFNDKRGKDAYTCLYVGDEVNKYVVIPAHFYEELQQYKWKDLDCNIPRDAEEYLTLKYGDWKTPVHRSQYSCYNKEDNKLVRDTL